MGIRIFSDESKDTKSPNPDPKHFCILSIIESTQGNFCLVLAKYYGCTTFDGKKLMLVKGSKEDIKKLNKLDPHLLGDKHIVIARFEPTEVGISIAKQSLKTMELMILQKTQRRNNVKEG